MRTILLLCLIFMIIPGLAAQEYLHPSTTDPDFTAESDRFMFFNHFWLNAHHYLYRTAESAAEPGAAKVLKGSSDFTPAERRAFTEAVVFYRDSLIRYDLRRSRYLSLFKRWVITHPGDAPLPIEPEIASHLTILNNFRTAYERHYWPTHRQKNREVINEHLDLVRKHETEFVERLTDFCRAEWQREKIRVDISYHSKGDTPYTSVRPAVHIVMDAIKSTRREGEWFELLLHEASHGLIKSNSGFVGGTILDNATVLGKKAPWQLWHAYLFYLTGATAKELLEREELESYEPYMFQWGVFSEYHDLLRKHLPRYVRRESSLGEATYRFLYEYYDGE